MLDNLFLLYFCISNNKCEINYFYHCFSWTVTNLMPTTTNPISTQKLRFLVKICYRFDNESKNGTFLPVAHNFKLSPRRFKWFTLLQNIRSSKYITFYTFQSSTMQAQFQCSSSTNRLKCAFLSIFSNEVEIKIEQTTFTFSYRIDVGIVLYLKQLWKLSST